MKRVFCLVMVFVSLFALASCSDKKKNKPEQNDEKPLVEEEVTKEISAEEGGKIESSDGQTSIEIPADALDSDTKITMRVYDAKGYPGTEDKTVISKVVEFEPTGTVFKKPVFISMTSTGTGGELRAAKKKVITAAVYREKEGKWSFSKIGYTVKLSHDGAGNPVITTAAGDPIMLNAAGDPIMMDAAGDPIMLSAAGDPIMVTAAGDPIMMSAAGDPIMMTTGHFTAYAFFLIDVEDEEEPVEKPDKDDSGITNEDEDIEITDEEDDVDTSDIEISDEDADEPVADEDNDVYVAECGNGILDPDEACDNGTDNGRTACAYGETSCTVCTTNCQNAEGSTAYCGDGIVQSNEKCDKAETGEGIGSSCSDDCKKIYSKVLCTGMAICTDGEGNQILCPKEDEDAYGQDAQYAARKGCVPHSYTEIENSEEVEGEPFIKDNVTGLTWWLTGRIGTYEEMKNECAAYGGIEDWRLPEPQELAALADHGMLYGNRIDPVYFVELYGKYDDGTLVREVSRSYGPDLILTSIENYFYLLPYGLITRMVNLARSSYSYEGYLMCVSGEKYGEASAENYSAVTENGDEMISDSSTNLFWQKEPVRKATWKEALSYCENLEYAGHTDWRLPNMNELATLIDYSKLSAEVAGEGDEVVAETEEGSEVVSSFPDMAPDIFWTSTPAPVDYLVWLIHMGYGLVGPSGEVENPEDEPIVGPQQPRSLKSIKKDEIAEEEEGYSVLCVRSDLDEKEEIPECDGTGTGPCIDANGTIWSSRIYPEIFADFDNYYLSSGSYYDPDCELRGSECDRSTVKTVYISDLAEMCRYLSENGSNRWRLPTIDEIRNTVTTEKLKKEGGTCGVTTVCREESCFDEEACIGDVTSKTTLNDYGAMFSGTMTLDSWSDGNDNWSKPWIVDAAEGLIYAESGIPISLLVQRCVLDNTLDDYETIPYTDPAGLTWSDLKPYADWRDAYDYCAELNTEEDTENFWRLPTMEELQTLVRHCEEGNCAVDFSGKYSVLGDISYFWSSDLPEYRKISCFDFSNVEVFEQDNDSYARFRCVSGGDSACAGNPCASVENSTGRCLTTTDPEIETGYVCECGEEYTWDGEECLQFAVVN